MSTENLKALTLWRLRARLIFTGTVGGGRKTREQRTGDRGREAGGHFRHYITEAAKKSPCTKIEDMEKANR